MSEPTANAPKWRFTGEVVFTLPDGSRILIVNGRRVTEEEYQRHMLSVGESDNEEDAPGTELHQHRR